MKKPWTLLTAVFFFIPFQLSAKYNNIVFEGAGMKGIAYAGVVQELEKHCLLDDIQNVAGTSSGAITALLLTLGYTGREMESICKDMNFGKLNDGQGLFPAGIHRTFHHYGWYRHKRFLEWLHPIIKAKTGNAHITFSQLKSRGFKNLYITGTCLNRQKAMVFCETQFPEMEVADAICVSMSIPLYFKAVFINEEGRVFKQYKEGLDICIDGGVVANFPMFIFDSTYTDANGKRIILRNKNTLGIRIDRDEQIQYNGHRTGIAPYEIEGMNDYLGAFYNLIIESVNGRYDDEFDQSRIITINACGVNPKVRQMKKNELDLLLVLGRQAVEEFVMN
ncbi:MAG TPA: patatin-like phospholipase family protein [Bacteroidia bacterium]